MRAQFITAVRALVLLTLLAGLVFPLAMTGVSQLAFHERADGSLLERNGHVVGSELLAQSFEGDAYFQPRPSAAGAAASGSMLSEDAGAPPESANPTDLSLVASGASNMGPGNHDLIATVAERAQDYRTRNALDAGAPVPVDAVTASGSGLDPHISVANARLQAPRVAAARGIPLDEVLRLIAEHTTGRVLGIFGEEGVNVLTLNLAPDGWEEGP